MDAQKSVEWTASKGLIGRNRGWGKVDPLCVALITTTQPPAPYMIKGEQRVQLEIQELDGLLP